MPRFTDNERIDAVTAKTLYPVDLIRITLGCSDGQYGSQSVCEANGEVWNGTVNLTTAGYNVEAEVNGEGSDTTFLFADKILDMPDVEEVMTMDIDAVEISILSIDREWTQKVQEMDLNGRTVEIWRLLLDPETYAKVGAPFKYYSGFITGGNINKSDVEGGTSVQLKISNSLYDFEKTSGFRCNVNDHQRHFPGDTGFQYTSSIARDIGWKEQG